MPRGWQPGHGGQQRHGGQVLHRSMTTLRTGCQGANLRYVERKSPYILTVIPHHATPRNLRKEQLLSHGWNASWQQLAVDDICDRHLAVRLKDGDILIYWTTAVGVVHRVGRDALSVHRAEVVDFADELAVIVIGFHA